MAAPLTTKPQVSGYKFLLRRLEHALLRRDTRMIHDPMRAQSRSVWIGVALAVVVCLGAGILALIKPEGKVGDSAIVMGKDTGALYVRVGDRLHPVLNLASARLITGNAAAPAGVKDKKLADYPRGPLLGIPGAPSALTTGAGTPPWTTCDAALEDGVETGVLVGGPDRADAPELRAEEAVYATDGDEFYLLYEGRRARVDTADATLLRALGLDAEHPRLVSRGLLDTLPAVDDLAVPEIPGHGRPGAVSGHEVGEVIKVDQATETEFYLVLADGVQKITESAASVLRAGDAGGAGAMAEVAPAAVSSIPRVSVVPVDDFPTHRPRVRPVDDAPVACVTWSRGEGDPRAQLTIAAGRRVPLPGDLTQTPLAGADGPGERTDWYASDGADGWYVQSTDSSGPVRRADTLAFVDVTGVRFGIPDGATASVLGFDGVPAPVPWSMLRLLAPGPELLRQNAMVAHDAVAPDPAGVPVAVSSDGGG